MAHLQLNKRAYNRCIEQGCRTIADVERSCQMGALTAEHIGEGSSEDVLAALDVYGRCRRETGEVDWPAFWAERPPQTHCLAITAESFRRLGSATWKASVGIFHLGKACAKLESAGFPTVSSLMEAARDGLPDIKGFGKSSQEDVAASLMMLATSIQEDGSVDWYGYARGRGFAILPDAAIENPDGPTLLKALPELCRMVIDAQFDERSWNIFNQRFLKLPETRPTLASIGELYGVTRERIRQIEEECIEAISRPVLHQDYRKLRFRLRNELSQFFLDARTHFGELSLPAWRESVWQQELSALWNVSPADLKPHLSLLMAVLGYESRAPDHPDLEAIVFDRSIKGPEVNRILRLVVGLHQVLGEHNLGLESFEIALKLKKKGLASLDEVPALVELCSSVESVGPDQFRLWFERLNRGAEMAYRVLAEHGEPLHREELLRQINARLPASEQVSSPEYLINRLTPDSRLMPIGKTGKWTLTEWGLETRPLIELIEETLKEADTGLSKAEIAEKVIAQRPGADSSVGLILSLNPNRFWKMGPDLYGLAAWRGRDADDVIWDQEAIGQFIEKFVSSRGGGEVPFAELRLAFQEESGTSPRSAQGLLAHHPAVEVREKDSRTRVVRLIREWRDTAKRQRSTARVLQSDRIVDAVSSYLMEWPSRELPLVDVVRRAEQDLKIIRASIYAAINQSDRLETVAVDGSVFKICRLPGAARPSYPQLERFKTQEWRDECARAVGKLTLEDVDVGLFILGRQFDHAMRVLLETARDAAGMAVTDGHLRNLQNRIDWALSNHLFTDRATLNLLKVERNERGHSPPSAAERESIFKFAPFVAELYLDYLVLIEERMSSLGHKSKPA